MPFCSWALKQLRACKEGSCGVRLTESRKVAFCPLGWGEAGLPDWRATSSVTPQKGPLKSSDLLRWPEESQEGIACRATVNSFYQAGIVKVIFKNLYVSSHFAITHGRVNGITYIKVSSLASFSFGSINLFLTHFLTGLSGGWITPGKKSCELFRRKALCTPLFSGGKLSVPWRPRWGGNLTSRTADAGSDSKFESSFFCRHIGLLSGQGQGAALVWGHRRALPG